MYLHKTKNGHYTPPCCYFSGELEVVEILRVGFCCKEVYRYSYKFAVENIPENELNVRALLAQTMKRVR